MLVCLTLAVCSIGFQSAVRALNVFLKKEAVPLRMHFDLIPSRLGAWEATGTIRKANAEMVEELGTDLYLDRQFRREGDGGKAWIGLHVAYYTGMIDAVPHVPDRCLVAGGFNIRERPRNFPMTLDRSGWRAEHGLVDPRTGAPYESSIVVDSITRVPHTVHMPAGDFALRTTEFSHAERPDARIYAGYFFIANGAVAVTPEDVKMLAFRPSEKFAYYCKLQFFTVGDEDLSPERFVDLAGEFTAALLPELMRCLPDWPEVQARKASDSTGSEEPMSQREKSWQPESTPSSS